MKYKFIKEQLGEFPVSRMCSALRVAPSGYYKWCRQVQAQTLSPRGEADKVLGEQIETEFVKSRRLYGSPRVHAAPNHKWAGDITGIWTNEGWLY